MRNSGLSSILVVAAICALIGAGTVVVREISLSQARERTQLINNVEGFYGAEIAFRSTLARRAAAIPESAPDSKGRVLFPFTNTFDNATVQALPSNNYNSATYVAGAPLNLKTTSQFSQGTQIIRRMGGAGLAQLPVAGGSNPIICGLMNVVGEEHIQLCQQNLPPPPSVDIKADGSDGPLKVAYNKQVTISWTSNSVSACTVTSNPAGFNQTGTSNAGVLSSAIKRQTVFQISCTPTPAGPQVVDSVTVDVRCPIASDFTVVSSQAGCRYQVNNGATPINWTAAMAAPPITVNVTTVNFFPGDYGNFACGTGCTMNFQGGGEYRFNSFAAGSNATMNFIINNDTDIRIYTRTEIAFGSGITGVSGGGTGKACWESQGLAMMWNGNSILMGSGMTFNISFFGVNNFTLGSGNTIRGNSFYKPVLNDYGWGSNLFFCN